MNRQFSGKNGINSPFGWRCGGSFAWRVRYDSFTAFYFYVQKQESR